MRHTWLCLALFALGVIAACSSDLATGIRGICDVTNPVSRITVTPSSATLFLRPFPQASDTLRLVPTAFGRFGAARTDVPFSYSSSNPEVATVDDSGVVTPQSDGNTMITVSSCDEEATVNISVTSAQQSVTVTLAADSILVGDSVIAMAHASDAATGPLHGLVFTWSIVPDSIASFTTIDDSTALVTGLAEGTVTVTASTGMIAGSATLVVAPAVTP
ncbi:MAG TPA: Ig-like domain-containing protein [Gemmatimonadaceae bacterium]|nr:Ig-like domain-containing protein [Gemmatimonadaceae bacterium]